MKEMKLTEIEKEELAKHGGFWRNGQWWFQNETGEWCWKPTARKT